MLFSYSFLFISFSSFLFFFFFFNDTATTEIYTLSLHDALPIFSAGRDGLVVNDLERSETCPLDIRANRVGVADEDDGDRKSTRLNSSHLVISYAVFCLKKKKKKVEINNLRTTENENSDVYMTNG